MSGTASKGWLRWRRFVPLIVIAALLVATFALGLHDYINLQWLGPQRDALVGLVADHFVPVLLVYALVYAALVAVAFPAPSVLTVFAGFLFGWPLASLLVVVSATTGSSLLFLAARSALGDSLRARFGQRIDGLAAGFERDALSYLLALRLAPVLPFWLVSVAPAFFRVKLHVFATATFFGIMPGTVTLAFLGSGLDSVLQEATARGEALAPADLITPQIIVAFVLLGLLAVIPPLVRYIAYKRGQRLPDAD